MAFTRQNTGNVTQFTRDGVLTETITTPPFQVFSLSNTNSSYSLGQNWSINIDGSKDTLSFSNGTTSVLTLTSSGFQLSSIVLPPQDSLPSSPAVGTMINQGDEIKIYL